jgi:hypothetical protein
MADDVTTMLPLENVHGLLAEGEEVKVNKFVYIELIPHL